MPCSFIPSTKYEQHDVNLLSGLPRILGVVGTFYEAWKYIDANRTPLHASSKSSVMSLTARCLSYDILTPRLLRLNGPELLRTYL